MAERRQSWRHFEEVFTMRFGEKRRLIDTTGADLNMPIDISNASIITFWSAGLGDNLAVLTAFSDDARQ